MDLILLHDPTYLWPIKIVVNKNMISLVLIIMITIKMISLTIIRIPFYCLIIIGYRQLMFKLLS